jgi:hypothetical protein
VSQSLAPADVQQHTRTVFSVRSLALARFA